MSTNSDPLSWGNRRHLLPKRLTYAFSLSADLTMEIPFVANALAPVCWPPREQRLLHRTPSWPARARERSSARSNTYRIPSLGDFVTSGGLRPDVPITRLIRADDQIVLSNRVTGELAGRLLFETDTTDLLRMDYTGVVDFKGWPKDPETAEAFRQVRGTAFVGCRHETDSPKYRWLVHNQLVGVGRIQSSLKDGAVRWASHPKQNQLGLGLLLNFSFDFYLGA